MNSDSSLFVPFIYINAFSSSFLFLSVSFVLSISCFSLCVCYFCLPLSPQPSTSAADETMEGSETHFLFKSEENTKERKCCKGAHERDRADGAVKLKMHGRVSYGGVASVRLRNI
jgi:hypothetical protein